MMEGREEDIRPCILCHNGCFNMCHYKGVPNDQDLSDSLHLSRCAVNAETMQWKKHYIQPAAVSRRVHIIGGGIGGMEAARVLKLRGHKPVIHEKGSQLGGTFIAAQRRVLQGQTPASCWHGTAGRWEQMEIEVHLNEEISGTEQFGSDPVIIATGAVPRLRKMFRAMSV